MPYAGTEAAIASLLQPLTVSARSSASAVASAPGPEILDEIVNSPHIVDDALAQLLGGFANGDCTSGLNSMLFYYSANTVNALWLPIEIPALSLALVYLLVTGQVFT